MKKISSETVCNFFYIFFIVYATLAVLALIMFIGFIPMMKKGSYLMGLQPLLLVGLATVQALFFYLICDRALITPKEVVKQQQVAAY